MNDFSAEGIQRAAEEVRRSNFGDFMFRDPGFGRTSRRNTTRKNTTRRNTSRRITSRKNTSRKHHTSRRTTRHHHHHHHCSKPCNWRTTIRGNQQISTCWDDGNMWELRIKQI